MEASRPYFNIDGPLVGRRLILALHPFRRNFLADATPPDLHAAVWLPVMGAFTMLAFGGLSTRFESDNEWKFDRFPFFSALFLLYIHITFSPIVYRRFVTATIAAIACLIRYSLAAMVVVALLCVIVGSRADFVVAAVGSGGCGVVLFTRMGEMLARQFRTRRSRQRMDW
jgi:hypothetical protein